MIDAPNQNVALTFEQLAQIETTKARLSNLESEINIAGKNLIVVNKDVAKATKEREYQEELCQRLSVEIAKKREELESLERSTTALETQHESVRKDELARQQILEQKEVDIATRLEALERAERNLSEQQERVRLDEAEQEAEREKLEAAKQAFEEAIKTVTW